MHPNLWLHCSLLQKGYIFSVKKFIFQRKELMSFMSKFFVVSSDILPDVLEKVIEARNLLQSGKVKRISEAVKAVGVSRGTYYKYKDAVFSLIKKNQDAKL